MLALFARGKLCIGSGTAQSGRIRIALPGEGRKLDPGFPRGEIATDPSEVGHAVLREPPADEAGLQGRGTLGQNALPCHLWEEMS